MPIAIVAGEPNSTSSEIIFKSWLLIKKFTHRPILVIGNIKLLNMQKKKMKFKISIKKINKNFKNKDLYGNKIPVYEMISGASIAIAAILLIIPGFVTDIIGLFLLFPFSRKFLVTTWIRKNKTKNKMRNDNILDGEIIEKKDKQDDL